MEMFIVIAFIAAVVWGGKKLLSMDGIIGASIRLSWNLACATLSIIPGFGWMEMLTVSEPTKPLNQTTENNIQAINSDVAAGSSETMTDWQQKSSNLEILERGNVSSDSDDGKWHSL